jgi:prepilin-type processing-associated H-X9-DG protein
LLPFLEQDNIYKRATTSESTLVRANVVPVFICPSDSSPIETAWARTNYNANYYVFLNVNGGSLAINQILDGTSNVVLFGEAYGRTDTVTVTATSTVTTTGFSRWADRSTTAGSYCRSTPGNTIAAPGTGNTYPAIALFQSNVPPRGNLINRHLYHAFHSGGMNVLRGDGSVRFATSGVSRQTWAWLLIPNDGNVHGSDAP